VGRKRDQSVDGVKLVKCDIPSKNKNGELILVHHGPFPETRFPVDFVENSMGIVLWIYRDIAIIHIQRMPRHKGTGTPKHKVFL